MTGCPTTDRALAFLSTLLIVVTVTYMSPLVCIKLCTELATHMDGCMKTFCVFHYFYSQMFTIQLVAAFCYPVRGGNLTMYNATHCSGQLNERYANDSRLYVCVVFSREELPEQRLLIWNPLHTHTNVCT